MKREENKIKAVIFDIGGVLLFPKYKKNNSLHLLNSIKATLELTGLINMNNKKKVDKIIRIYFKSAKGIISKKETIKRLSKELFLPKKRIQFVFEEIYKKNIVENKELIKFAKKLKKKGYKIGIITDQWHLSEKILVNRKSFLIFDSIISSCKNKVKKPDKKPYLLSLCQLKIKANQAIFIDDRERNIKPAKKIGMYALLFKNNNQLFKELKKFGIKC